jgi:hypothetical protein
MFTYSNNAPITIRDGTTGAPYPSTIPVGGLIGPVGKITVALNGFTHSVPSDSGVMLVDPTGTNKVVLMNKAGGGGGPQSVNGIRLGFDQSTSFPLIPQGATLTNGTYRPADYKAAGYSFPGPAPASPYTATLDTFNGRTPNGTWSLYVVDDTPGDSGAITNGWTLNITTCR